MMENWTWENTTLYHGDCREPRSNTKSFLD